MRPAPRCFAYRLSWLVFGLGLFFALPGKALAAPVLVLGFLEEGKPNQRIRQGVVQFLARMGEEVVAAPLSAADQQCTQTDCLVRLGERHQAQRLVGGEIIPNDSSYRILVWLFDRVSELPNTTEASCVDCTAEMLLETVARTTGRVLEVSAAPPPAPSQEKPSAPVSAAQQAPAGCSGYKTFARGLAVGSLAAITVAGLVTGFALAGQNGQIYQAGDGVNDPTIAYNFTPHYRLALGLSGLSAAGLVAAALPWQQVLGRPAPECPRQGPAGRASRYGFGRGLAIGALGSLTLAGLVTAFTLTGLSGSPYGYNADGSAITYNLKPHYQAAYAVSAGMAAGLGLAIFLP